MGMLYFLSSYIKLIFYLLWNLVRTEFKNYDLLEWISEITNKISIFFPSFSMKKSECMLYVRN